MNKIQFDEIQKRAIALPLLLRETKQGRVGIVCGGPGTGKSSVIAEMIRSIVNFDSSLEVRLCAPTGQAADVINKVTQKQFDGRPPVSPAMTIHRLLGCRGPIWEYRPDNKLHCDILILDEASMIDAALLWQLISSISDRCIIVLLGDKDQLQPVGAGAPFLDIVNSGLPFVIKLGINYRQMNGSMTGQSVENISNGQMPVFGEAGKDSLGKGMIDDCFWTEQSDRDLIAGTLAEVIAPWHYAGDNYLLVVPQRVGPIGFMELNPVLQGILNPSEKTGLKIFGQLVKEGDLVRQTKNNYKLGRNGVFNGYLGRVVYAHSKGIAVEYPGFPDPEIVIYTEQKEWNDLVLAYAITGHSAQGSQADNVCVLCHRSNWNMLTRSWIYVGFSRTQGICHVVGETDALKHAVGNQKSVKRNTYLSLAFSGEK